jgi:hypothetical protein
MELPASQLQERREALAALRARHSELRTIHALIADDLRLAGSPRASHILSDAVAQVALWEKDRLCSPFYIRTWRRVLRSDHAAEALMRIVRNPSDSADALLQNSPFSHVLRDYGLLSN